MDQRSPGGRAIILEIFIFMCPWRYESAGDIRCFVRHFWWAMQLHVTEYGQGDPLILLHGLFGLSDNWHTLGKRFGEQWRVLIPDLRNHGRSPHSSVMNFDVMAGDITELMDARGVATAYVLGHSLGGKVAMKLALTQPERVQRLIVADIAPRAYLPHHLVIFQGLFGLDFKGVKTRGEADDILAQKIPSVEIRQLLLKNLQPAPEGGYRWKFNLTGLYQNYDLLIAAIKSKTAYTEATLFIRGEKSDYILDSDLPDIRKLFPKARFLTIPDAGHWVHAVAPQAFYEAVVEFLRAVID